MNEPRISVIWFTEGKLLVAIQFVEKFIMYVFFLTDSCTSTVMVSIGIKMRSWMWFLSEFICKLIRWNSTENIYDFPKFPRLSIIIAFFWLLTLICWSFIFEYARFCDYVECFGLKFISSVWIDIFVPNFNCRFNMCLAILMLFSMEYFQWFYLLLLSLSLSFLTDYFEKALIIVELCYVWVNDKKYKVNSEKNATIIKKYLKLFVASCDWFQIKGKRKFHLFQTSYFIHIRILGCVTC